MINCPGKGAETDGGVEVDVSIIYLIRLIPLSVMWKVEPLISHSLVHKVNFKYNISGFLPVE